MLPLPEFAQFLSVILAAGIVVGGVFAFRNGRQTQLTKIQNDTIEALQQRIEALEGKIGDLEKQNAVQQHIIDTVTSALEQEGRFITINGDMVTISDQDGRRKVHRKRTISAHPTATPLQGKNAKAESEDTK